MLIDLTFVPSSMYDLGRQSAYTSHGVERLESLAISRVSDSACEAPINVDCIGLYRLFAFAGDFR